MITLKLCGDVYDCRCHQRLLEDCGKSGGLFRVEVGGGWTVARNSGWLACCWDKERATNKLMIFSFYCFTFDAGWHLLSLKTAFLLFASLPAPFLSHIHFISLKLAFVKRPVLGTNLAERVLREGHLLWAAFYHPYIDRRKSTCSQLLLCCPLLLFPASCGWLSVTHTKCMNWI